MSCQSETKTKCHNNFADDLGFGDVSAYNQGTLNTPNIDRIANEGIRFNNGHSSSATCSPSRYALLTGTYPWRNKNAKISTGASLIIDTSQQTLPKMFKKIIMQQQLLENGIWDSELEKSTTILKSSLDQTK